MNRKSKVVFLLSILLFVAVAAPVGLYFYHFIIPAYATSRVAGSFLDCLVRDDFKGALQNVAYFDEYSDFPPTISYRDAERLWIGRVKSLKQSGTYIKSFSNVRTSIDDGYPVGDVMLTVVKKGREDTYRASIHFSNTHGRWKIQAIYDDPRDLTRAGSLEHAISGDLGPAR